MSIGSTVKTLDVLIKYTMSRAVAEKVKSRFIDMGLNGDSPSYLDCVLFDAALEVLGEEQAYYGIPDEDWQRQQEEAKEMERRYTVKTIDVTDTWHELLG